MSRDDFDPHHAAERLNALAAMLLDAGQSTPLGALVGPLSRLTSGLKPSASLGMGIAVGSAAVLAISAIVKARAGRHEGAPVAVADTADADCSAKPAPRKAAPPPDAAAAPPPAAAPSPAEPPTKRAPRRKTTRKPAGTAR